MYFDACENLANEYPNLAQSIERIDSFITNLSVNAKLDPERTSRFCNMSVSEVVEILDHLVAKNIVNREVYLLHCGGCGTLIPKDDYTQAWDSGVLPECSQCGVSLTANNSTEVVQYIVKSGLFSHQSDKPKSSLMAVTATFKQDSIPDPEDSTPPRSPPRPEKLTLLLSGGGYRAAAFHIGFLRWLYEHAPPNEGRSFLKRVCRVVGISGGSYTASHFFCHSDRYVQDFQVSVEQLCRFLTTQDIRRQVFSEDKTVSEIFQSLFGSKTIDDNSINSAVCLEVLGTDLTNGDAVVFNKEGIHTYETDIQTRKLKARTKAAPLSVRISHAVHASSAFPPFFPPLVLKPDLFSGVKSASILGNLNGHEVVDGGVRDNCGVEYSLIQNWSGPHSDTSVVVSDAGLPFDWSNEPLAEQLLGIWGARLLRIIDIQMFRSAMIDHSDTLDFDRVSIESANQSMSSAIPDLALHSQQLPKSVAGVAAMTPTDLVPLSSAQFYALVRLGYQCADCSLRSKWQANRVNVADKDFWKSIFPKEAKSLENLNDGFESLESLLGASRKSRFNGPIDAYRQVRSPIRNYIRNIILRRFPFSSIVIWVLLVVAVMFAMWFFLDLRIVRYRRPPELNLSVDAAIEPHGSK